MTTDLELVNGSNALAFDLSICRPPAQVLKEAREAAQALRDVVSQKQNPVIFNNEQYLEFEDWQTVARFYGVTARVRETRFIKYDDVVGFEATADAIMVSSGSSISAADAMCLNDEEKWSTRPKYEWQTVDGKRKRVQVGEVAVPLFQLRSMAQTRACAKALRNVMGWVVVLSGYKPTVAEEMTGDERYSEPAAGPRMPERKSEQVPSEQAPRPTPKPGPIPPTPPPVPPVPTPKPGAAHDDDAITEPQRKRFYAIWKGTGVPEDIVKAKLKEIGYEHSTEIRRADYEDLCRWAADFGRQERSDYDDNK
jgi:hypothetical protein